MSGRASPRRGIGVVKKGLGIRLFIGFTLRLENILPTVFVPFNLIVKRDTYVFLSFPYLLGEFFQGNRERVFSEKAFPGKDCT